MPLPTIILRAPVRSLLALVGACLLAIAAPPASAASFTVTTNNDYGQGSLRHAIEGANALPGADEIRFVVTGDIVLAAELPEVTDDLVIDGPGTDVVAIKGGELVRLLRIAAGTMVEVNDITLADGLANPQYDRGGCIINDGTLTLRNLVIRNCESNQGGAIYNESGAMLTLTNSYLEDLHANKGGGVYNAAGANLVVVGSTIRDAWASDSGGGIYSYEADVILTNSKIADSHSGMGGAIASTGAFSSHEARGSLLVERSVLIDNFAEFNGGAIHNYGQNAIIRNSTLAQNEVSYGRGGGAVYTELEWAVVTVTNSTLFDNQSENGGGAVHNFNVYPSAVMLVNSTLVENDGGDAAVRGSFTAKNSIFDNWGDNCTAVDFLGEAITDLGDNFSTDDTCGTFTQVTSDQLALGTLAANGGPTPTLALLPASVAIDSVVDCTDLDGQPIATDQRGVPRPADGNQNAVPACDAGAFELGNEVIFANGFD